MYKKLLVPLDGSRLGNKAITHASEVAQKFGSTVTLLQVVKPVSPISLGEPVGVDGSYAAEIMLETAAVQEKRNLESARRYLKQQLKKLTAKGINGSYDIVIGSPSEAIIKYCKKNKIDLVVMTTHGRSGIKRAFMGSVAEAVIRDKGVPVLAIRI